MKAGLLAWAHAERARARRRPGPPLPVLWLFTDAERLPDPRPAAAALPRGLAGVVLRHDRHPARAAIGRDLARICRMRRLALVVAGDARLAGALRAGVHLREGRWPSVLRVRRAAGRLVTSSAHGGVGLRRAWRAGATLAFLSPVFPTASHPGAPTLGVLRWARAARQVPLPVAALGGVSAGTVRRLPRGLCRAVGGIGAMR